MKTNKEKLFEEIDAEFEALKNVKSEEKSAMIDNLSKLYRLYLEESEYEKKDSNKWISYTIEIGKSIIPVSVFAILTLIGYKFEESGTMTSFSLRNVWNKFKLFN